MHRLTVLIVFSAFLNASSQYCSNGGTVVAQGCVNSQQCTAFTSCPVTCCDGNCCTVPPLQNCPSGQPPVATGCQNSAQCVPYAQGQQVSCINGQLVATGCQDSQQCTPYSTCPVTCDGGNCCTVPEPGPTPPEECTNGGTVVATGCSNSAQCIPYAQGQTVTCINSVCCTVPQSQCPNGGTLVATGCSTSSQCVPYAQGAVVTCLDAKCCTVPSGK
ncbi:hypothetical protein QR680_004334 [Steinernema hermaphroditum]|uniref:Uncharacterized protein n=1 Tax=Steinernema hermaphroditum TaxID=289476 RepID=A0AA39HPS7_9BILA|nr:hypothetical protein QR680_004334 [Steinernema hermaphroditum]